MKRNKSCKTICTAMAAVTLVAMLAGCNSEDPKKPVASVQESVAASESTGPSVPAPSVPDTSEPNVPAPSVPDVPAPSVPDNPGPAPSVPDDPGPTPSVPDDPDPLPPDDIHEHAYTETVTKATCTEDGFTTYTCACGDSYTGDVVSATGHSWSDWVTVQEPTEEATGTAERKCSACDATESKALDKLIPNHTHSYTSKVTKKATCSAEGIKTFSCSCGSSYTEAIAKTEHRYRGKEVWPTCESKGYTTYTCRDCGHSYRGNYKDIVDHSYCWETVDPTCTEDGYTLYMCDYCLDYYYEDITPATGHSFTQYKSNGDATCSEDGTKTAVCDNRGCNKKNTVTDTGSALGHSYSVTVVEPTMYNKGYTLNICNVCGVKHKDNYNELSEEARQQFIKDVEAAAVKYINQFRKEQGDTEATVLPILSQIAQERAYQIRDDFRHDSAALRKLYNQYKYGEWVDGTPWGGSQYYNGNAMEAIGKCSAQDIADEVGLTIAYNVRNSKGHWDYVGSSDYQYIAVGISFDSVKCTWYICILQTAKNYG